MILYLTPTNPRQHLPGGQPDQHAARHPHPQRHLLPAGGAGGLRALRPHRLYPTRHPAGQQVSTHSEVVYLKRSHGAFILLYRYITHYYTIITSHSTFSSIYKSFSDNNPC